MKKFLSLCLTGAILFAMLAACGKTEEFEAPVGMKLASDTAGRGLLPVRTGKLGR